MKLSHNRAISFSLLYKVWQAGAGLITIPVVLLYLGPQTQGYYYTFISLIALQSFFELGFSIVISVYASHEWHKLSLTKDGKIVGDKDALSRLISLGRFVFKYFGTASCFYVLIAGTVGFFVLSKDGQASEVWVVPWLLHVTISAVSLWLIPFLSILEGCNQVASVAKFRLIQSLISNAVLWGALAAGCQLWSLPIYGGVALTMLMIYIGFQKRQFFIAFVEQPNFQILSWKNDLLPMQWRLAIQGLFSYMSFPLFTILVYSYLGAVEAGRMGMTLQIVGGIQSLGLVFLMARAPEFGLLAASGNHFALGAKCKAATHHSLLVMSTLCLLTIIVIAVASEFKLPQAHRVLGVAAFSALSVGIILTGLIQGAAVYLRAQKKELLTAVGVTGGLLYGLSSWLACLKFGNIGIAISYATVTGFVVLPLTLFVLQSHNKQTSKFPSPLSQ